MSKREWFGEWFDSPYYHILYKHHGIEEAEEFIDNLTQHLSIAKEDKILDLACGKGRHSIYLNKKGFDVVGLDLSEHNINYAKQFENERLHFNIHDMREPYTEASFDIILNLFTSFGYFDTKMEHLNAINAISSCLNSGGKFILDFLNPYMVIHQLKHKEIKTIDGIDFHLTRRISDDDFIVKDISFSAKGENFFFQEKVKALRRIDFLDYFEQAGLDVIAIFGDYQLNTYNAEASKRMIFEIKKS